MSETYRIVIADDEAIICMDLKEILEEAGHEVVGICLLYTSPSPRD